MRCLLQAIDQSGAALVLPELISTLEKSLSQDWNKASGFVSALEGELSKASHRSNSSSKDSALRQHAEALISALAEFVVAQEEQGAVRSSAVLEFLSGCSKLLYKLPHADRSRINLVLVKFSSAGMRLLQTLSEGDRVVHSAYAQSLRANSRRFVSLYGSDEAMWVHVARHFRTEKHIMGLAAVIDALCQEDEEAEAEEQRIDDRQKARIIAVLYKTCLIPDLIRKGTCGSARCGAVVLSTMPANSDVFAEVEETVVGKMVVMMIGIQSCLFANQHGLLFDDMRVGLLLFWVYVSSSFNNINTTNRLSRPCSIESVTLAMPAPLLMIFLKIKSRSSLPYSNALIRIKPCLSRSFSGSPCCGSTCPSRGQCAAGRA